MQLAERISSKSFFRFAGRIRKGRGDRGGQSAANLQVTSGSALQCCVAYNKYGGYCVPMSSRHRPAAQRILAGQIWEPETIEMLISHGNDGDVIHAGTYFGDFLPALSQCCAPGRRVWAFEPNPENYQCAQITGYINAVRNIELINACLGERQGARRMVTTDAAGRALGGASRIVDCENGMAGAVTVNCVAIDEVVPEDRTVSIIQLDVEGFEKPALSGALKTIERCTPTIILETLPDEQWLSENILHLGYRVAGKVHDNTILTHLSK